MRDLDANFIIANAPDPVFVSDLQGKILLANEAVSELLGFREAERGRSIPALAVTAYARAEDRTRALSAGFQMHVAKPLEPADFVAAIASLVSKGGRAALDSAA